ncbi:hypothetical protein GCM10023322_46210 [Rugosimonospora acidiphila]|uniref:Immunity protein Imm1 n=1 Tax=Rugosimonospora acidiphila TaxID=556531 RepID=A0ABP9S2L3_9ACTN
MNAYTLAWGHDERDPSGQHTVAVRTIAELDDALDRLAADGAVRLIDVYEGRWAEGEPEPPYGFQLVWGHPERAALTWLGGDSAIAVDPSLPHWPEVIRDDQDESSPRYTRIAPRQARAAVRQYVQTGRRPTNVLWEQR